MAGDSGQGAPALRLEGVAKSFGATVALDGVDLVVQPGEVHALIGENGAGKSTLMNVVAGALRPDAGRMWLHGRRYAPGSTLDARRNAVALIHQELSLCPHLTVTENVLLGRESARRGWLNGDAGRQRTRALLDNFPHPELGPDRIVGSLPIAAQQVVEICRALSAEARVVLMDEPTSSLQRNDVERLFDLIRRLRSEGIAVVYISHFLEEVREVADRYTVLRDGRSVDTGSLSEVTNAQLISAMVGRPMGGIFPVRTPRPAADPILTVSGLTAPPVLKEASFELRPGEILGIAGLMGSGRTEMVRALFGLDAVKAGTITLRGHTLSARGARASTRLRQGFGYLSEDRKGEGLALPMSIADNLTLTAIGVRMRLGGWLNLGEQRARAARWVERLGIRAGRVTLPVRTLSGGNQQKVVIGRLLDQDADILLLDEPTRGIDIGSKEQVYETIASAAEAGKAVLMVSSYLPELFGMCDRIAVMSRGRLSASRPIAEWTPETVMTAAIGEADSEAA